MKEHFALAPNLLDKNNMANSHHHHQQLLSEIASNINVLSSALVQGQHNQNQNSQRHFSSVEDEVASTFNRQTTQTATRPFSSGIGRVLSNPGIAPRPATPITATTASSFGHTGPMYTMRRNFTSGQHRGRAPYKRNTKVTSCVKGPFFRDIVLLPGPDFCSVPRQTNKVWLSENGHILTACCLQKEWTEEEVIHNIRALFANKIPDHSNLTILASVHTKLLPPTLAPGQALNGTLMHRLFKTKPVYVKPSVQILQSHTGKEDVQDTYQDQSDDDFPSFFESTHTYASGSADANKDTTDQEEESSVLSCQKKDANNECQDATSNIRACSQPTAVIDLTEEYNALFNDPSPFEPFDEPENIPKSTVNENISEEISHFQVLQEALAQLSSGLNYDNISKFNVSRNHLWESARQGCSKKSFSPNNKISVKFTDDIGISEGAVDLGGPTREFLSLLIKHINRSSMFIGDDQNKFITCLNQNLQSGDYSLAGRIVAMSLVHGGPGPNSFSSILFNSIACNPRSVVVSIEDVYDEKIANQLRELQASDTIAAVDSCLENMETLLELAGIGSYVRKVEDRFKIIKDVSWWYVVGRTTPALESFKEGLSTLGVLSAIKCQPQAFKKVLCYQEDKLDASKFHELFGVDRSEQGTQNFVTESRVLMYWRELLDDIEDNNSSLSFPEVLSFTSGTPIVPPCGFNPGLKIEFLHFVDINSKFPTANTCSCILRLPTAHKNYEDFKEAMEFGMKNSKGFGLP